MKKILNHDVIAEPVQMAVRRKTPIKMAEGPQIAICIPIGPKRWAEAYTCPDCEKTWETRARMVPNFVPIHLMLAHMNLQQPLNIGMTYLIEAGRLSAEARQIMTMQAIGQGAKYILYWDDDTLPPPHGLFTLHNFMERSPEVGAVSGVYTTRSDPNEPLVYKAHGAGAAWDFQMGPGATPEPILGAGAGFMLARVEAIVECNRILEEEEGKPTPIWADEQCVPDAEGEGKNFWGHDMRFCRVLNENGWPVYVDGRVLCGHVDAMTGQVFEVPLDSPGFRWKEEQCNTTPTS